MIESTYWRAELRSELAWLKRQQRYRRWTEKQQVLYERKLMLVAFQVRSLIDRPKVHEAARRAVMPVVRYKKIGDRPFTHIGSGWPEERFDMNRPEHVTLSVMDVCNQLIHYYWMQTWSEGKAFAGVLVFSDYMRHKWAYEFRIDDLLCLFRVLAQDSSAVVSAEFRWDEKAQDYVVVHSSGPQGA
jgi:hypothetical protein